MSSVSSLDGSGLSNYYHQTMRELQDQVETEAKRNREVREKQIESLEKQYQNALERKDRENELAIRSVRKDADEAIRNEKEKYDASLEDFKEKARSRAKADETQSGLGNYYHESLERLKETVQKENERNRELQRNRA